MTDILWGPYIETNRTFESAGLFLAMPEFECERREMDFTKLVLIQIRRGSSESSLAVLSRSKISREQLLILDVCRNETFKGKTICSRDNSYLRRRLSRSWQRVAAEIKALIADRDKRISLSNCKNSKQQPLLQKDKKRSI